MSKYISASIAGLLFCGTCAAGIIGTLSPAHATSASSTTGPSLWGSFQRVDIDHWQSDDYGGPDTILTTFANGIWTKATPFVDMEDSRPTDMIVATFSGQIKGDWQQRASVRMYFIADLGGPEQTEADCAGAQVYLYQTSAAAESRNFTIQCIQIAGLPGTFRVGVKGKTYLGKASLFGASHLVVQRYRSDI